MVDPTPGQMIILMVKNEIISTFNSADILGKGSNRVVFNIGGNNYRIICKYYFGDMRVHLFVKWIGTHVAYTKLCNDGKQYEIELLTLLIEKWDNEHNTLNDSSPIELLNALMEEHDLKAKYRNTVTERHNFKQAF